MSMLGMGYVILLWHYLSLPYNYFVFFRGNEESSSGMKYCMQVLVTMSYLAHLMI